MVCFGVKKGGDSGEGFCDFLFKNEREKKECGCLGMVG